MPLDSSAKQIVYDVQSKIITGISDIYDTGSTTKQIVREKNNYTRAIGSGANQIVYDIPSTIITCDTNTTGSTIR